MLDFPSVGTQALRFATPASAASRTSAAPSVRGDHAAACQVAYRKLVHNQICLSKQGSNLDPVRAYLQQHGEEVAEQLRVAPQQCGCRVLQRRQRGEAHTRAPHVRRQVRLRRCGGARELRLGSGLGRFCRGRCELSCGRKYTTLV
jgi:hypothetical protein